MNLVKAITAISLVSVIAIVSGCATGGNTHYTGRKNTLVRIITPDKDCIVCDVAPDWYRIAGMTNEEICKAINCGEKVVSRDVPGPEKIVTREVPGPERIVYRDVPGPERIVTKEVEVQAAPTKGVTVLPLVVIPGALFDFDKATLKPHGLVEMNRAATLLKDRGYPMVVINGHTDPVGTEDYNQQLSERRAETVRDFLTSKGVPANTITTKGYGKDRPIASNDTEEGKALNRRVEIYQVNP